MSQNRPAAFSSLRMGGKSHSPIPAIYVVWCCFHRVNTNVAVCRGHPRKGSRWCDGRNSRDAIYPVQDRRQRLLRCRIPDQDFPLGRGCRHQACFAGQEIQGINYLRWPASATVTFADFGRTVSFRLCASCVTLISSSSRPSTTPMANE